MLYICIKQNIMNLLNKLLEHYPFCIVFICKGIRGVYARTNEAEAEDTYIKMVIHSDYSNVKLIKSNTL